MSRHGYRGDGAYGQFCLVLPEHDAVIAATSATERMQDYLDLVWRHLLPALHPAPLTGRDAEDAALRDRLARLSLPPAPGGPVPPARAAGWAGGGVAPDGGTCADPPTPTGAEVTAAPDGGWTLTLTDRGDPLPLRLPDAGWTVAEEPVPTAVSGGWTGPATLSADVLFL